MSHPFASPWYPLMLMLVCLTWGALEFLLVVLFKPELLERQWREP